MLAIIASALLGLYVFFPDFLFTRLTAQFIELKKHQRSKFEDVVAGLTVAAIPFVITLTTSHFVWLIGHWPLPIIQTAAEKITEYKTVFSAAYSEPYFNAHQQQFWDAAKHVGIHQVRFLFWNYVCLVGEVLVVRLATKNFGNWRKYRIYRVLFGNTVLRRSSQWYVLFRAFMFPYDRKPKVMIDVLTTDNHLYDGELADYFMDSSGNLSEVLLKGFRRFRFAEFDKAREAAKPEGKKIKSADYWTTIPGANFLIPYSKIANINIRYVFTNETLAEGAQLVLRELKFGPGVTVEITGPEQDRASSLENFVSNN
jgi:hypothetical protein